MSIRSDDFNDFIRPWLKPLFIFLAVGIIVFSLRQVGPTLAWFFNAASPFIIALILAYILHPIVSFVQRRLRLGRVGGILIVALTIMLLLAGLLIWLLPLLYNQLVDALINLRIGATGFISRVSDKYLDPTVRANIQTQIDNLLANLDTSVQAIASDIGNALQPVAAGSAAAVRTVAGGVFRTVGTIGGIIAAFCFILVVTFYYLADMHKIPGVLRRLIPENHRERVWELLLKSDRAVGGFLRGQLIACAAVGALSAILLFMIGLKQYAVLIGVFAGLANFIPYMGPILGATPAVLWALFTQSITTWDARGIKILLIIGIFALVQGIDGFVFQPLIIGKQASLHPLMIMLALVIGSQFGIGGMIIAVPLACIAQVLWVELFWKYRRDDLALPPSSAEKS